MKRARASGRRFLCAALIEMRQRVDGADDEDDDDDDDDALTSVDHRGGRLRRLVCLLARLFVPLLPFFLSFSFFREPYVHKRALYCITTVCTV